MKTTVFVAALCAVSITGATAVSAQETGFEWEGTAEIGVDSTLSSDDASAELTDTYVTISAAFEAALTNRITAFGGLTFESVSDAVESRQLDDLGLYVSELGLRFDLGGATVSAGKISPVFGVAWDAAPGFYGTSLAEDYELAEMIGLTAETTLASTGGVLSFAVFYADDTGLSNSVGTKRGRNSVAAGGVGNTSKLNNFAIQYTQEFGATTGWVGARQLSAGTGDVSDENSIIAGLAHDFGNGFDTIFEVAHFSGAGGKDENATYATLGGAYGLGDWTFSSTGTLVDTQSGTDSMIAPGVDRALTENSEINFGLARFDVDGVKSTSAGLAAVVSF
ncbi:hypothetical protein [Sulfitobacter sp. CW3]|uniref:hypothetical protein n=1 Tax=Sulfitobacter sp. CW3 TaxID=2861965 RepID=UPI001C5FA748|nr:hypothetical protein [Sulfitobacter sp. CW3]MBW4963586.1 hypothetical protein [Sulfitobacter sp. CW3]